jgi:DNA modification methylase
MASDLYDRGYGHAGVDFLKAYEKVDNIITNPPYKHALEFVEHALKLANKKVAMFLKLTFLEGKGRYKFFQENPPRRIYVFSYRAMCYLNGDDTIKDKKSSAVAYAWFVWEKGFKGKPEIEWII